MVAAMHQHLRSSELVRQTEHAVGAPTPLSPITSENEGEQSRGPPGASSEDAPIAVPCSTGSTTGCSDAPFSNKELNWMHFVNDYVEQKDSQL